MTAKQVLDVLQAAMTACAFTARVVLGLLEVMLSIIMVPLMLGASLLHLYAHTHQGKYYPFR